MSKKIDQRAEKAIRGLFVTEPKPHLMWLMKMAWKIGRRAGMREK